MMKRRKRGIQSGLNQEKLLQLQRREGDVKHPMWLLAGARKQKRKALTIDQRVVVRDAWWRAVETVDDGNSWGKITARSSRLSRREESSNGVWSRRLASGECSGGWAWHWGKKWQKGLEDSSLRAFYRRRGGSGWQWAHPSMSACRQQVGCARPWCDEWSPALVGSMCSWSGLKLTRATVVLGHTVDWSSPLKYVFKFSKLQQVCKIQNALLCCSKFSKLCMRVYWIFVHNIPFGRKFKFQTEFELKIQEANCFWIWDKFIGGSNMFAKIW
jgi:hypothetical protein